MSVSDTASRPHEQRPAERQSVSDDHAVARDIVLALIQAGIHIAGLPPNDPEQIGSSYGRLFNAVRITISSKK